MEWTRSDNEVLATLQDLVAIDSVNPALPAAPPAMVRAMNRRLVVGSLVRIVIAAVFSDRPF